MDISYGAPYLSEELQKEFDSKIQWMVLRNEEVIQKNVRLLRAMPVSVQDEPGEEQDVIWYLIHGKVLCESGEPESGAWKDQTRSIF